MRTPRIAVAATVVALLSVSVAVVGLQIGPGKEIHEKIFGEPSKPLMRGERELVNGDGDEDEGQDAEAKARPGRPTNQVWPAGAQVGAVTNLAAPGWTGESVMDSTQDDWEPAIAADPQGTYAYVLTTRYSEPKACGNCPKTQIWLYRSTDGGQTWGTPSRICNCPGTASQNDPQIEVGADGAVYAVWMDDYNPGVVFARSTDHGVTWSAPLAVKSKSMKFTDKPILAISPSGQDVYINFNSSDNYFVASHNFGASFSAPVKTNGTDGRYYFAGGGAVLPNGTIVFTDSSFTQTSTGPVFVHVIRSTNGGASWTQTQVASTPQQPTCVANGCPVDFYGTIPAIAADAAGKLVLTYTGPTVAQGPQRVYAIRSTDGGVTWSAPTDLGGPQGANANFSAIAATGTGDFRMYFMDARNGPDAWNTWYRRSTDGGVTWGAEVKISDATSGPAYVNPNGFGEPYGDYGEIDITATGTTLAIWGEGPDYIGPGGCWINRTT
jgi:hypothetical protein